VRASSDLPGARDDGATDAIADFVSAAPPVAAVGHRFVHGGLELRGSVVVDAEVLERIHSASELAPLHNAAALSALAVLRRLRPDVPHVACFDSAFHKTLPDAAALYALPRGWIDRFGIRRFGFHGLSHAYAVRRAAELLGRPLAELRLVTCHLGAGASLAAVSGGASVDTTMGFTPNEGLVMATRSGSVDPGAVLWLARHAGLELEEMERLLEGESGLRGLAGTGDMRAVIEASDGGDRRARLALDVYLHRLRGCIAAMAAAMGGIDGLIFTGGVGERSPRIREEACRGLSFLGIEIDERRASEGIDRHLTGAGARVAVLAIESREDLEIAAEVRRALGW
jgi:acetate kinase